MAFELNTFYAFTSPNEMVELVDHREVYEVVARTPTMVTLRGDDGVEHRRKVKTLDGGQFVKIDAWRYLFERDEVTSSFEQPRLAAQ